MSGIVRRLWVARSGLGARWLTGTGTVPGAAGRPPASYAMGAWGRGLVAQMREKATVIRAAAPGGEGPRATLSGNLPEIMTGLQPGEKTKIQVLLKRAEQRREPISWLVISFAVVLFCDVVKEVAKEIITSKGNMEDALKDASVAQAITAFIYEQVVPYAEESAVLKEVGNRRMLFTSVNTEAFVAQRNCDQKLHWDFSYGPVVGLFAYNSGTYQGLDILPVSLWNSTKVATASTVFEYKSGSDVREKLRIIAFFRNDIGYYRLLAIVAVPLEGEAAPAPVRAFPYYGGYGEYLQDRKRERCYRMLKEARQSVARTVPPMPVKRSGDEAASRGIVGSEPLVDVTEAGEAKRAREAWLQNTVSQEDLTAIEECVKRGEPLVQAPYSNFRDRITVLSPASLKTLRSQDTNCASVAQQGQRLNCLYEFPRSRNLWRSGKAVTKFTTPEHKARAVELSPPAVFTEIMTTAADSSEETAKKKIKIIRKKKKPAAEQKEEAEKEE